jgi:hypothetical protein
VVLRWNLCNYLVIASDCADLRGSTGRSDFTEELDVRAVVVTPLFRKIVFVIDRFDGTHRLARSAVNTLVGVDVEHPVALVDTVNGTLIDARAVFEIHTRQGNHIRHNFLLLSTLVALWASDLWPRDGESGDNRRPKNPDVSDKVPLDENTSASRALREYEHRSDDGNRACGCYESILGDESEGSDVQGDYRE